MLGVPSHLTPLRLSQPLEVDLTVVTGLLDDRAGDWLGSPVPAPRPGSHRFLTDLSLPLRDRSPMLTFTKAAFVDLGEPDVTAERYEVEIGWRSSSLAPLFPVFAGKLTVLPTEIILDGYYAPPGGELGAVLDKAFLNIAARGTARWFLGKVAQALRSTAPSAALPASPAPSASPSTGLPAPASDSGQ